MMQVSAQSPLPARLLSWAAERFPAVNGVLCLVLYGAALLCGRAGAQAGAVTVSARDSAGFFAAYAFLLMLRVYDEHKDYALDLKNHPQRVLQRGLITLGHLKVAGALAIALQLAVSLFLDGGVGAITGRWLVVFLWSGLMAKEFFVSEWLGRRLVLYALSHMIVMPMALLWMAQMGAGQGPLSSAVWLLALLSFFSGFAFEIGRKTRAPEQERETVDSYSKSLGLRGAVGALLVLCALTGAVLLLLLREIGGGALPAAGTAVAIVATLVPVAPLLRFVGAPSAKGAKLNEAVLGLQSLLAYLTLSGVWLAQRGIAWR